MGEQRNETTEPVSSDTEIEIAKDSATDNVGEASVELNVEELIAEIEAESQVNAADPDCKVRRRLEDMLDRKRSAEELIDFEDYDIDS